METLSPILWRDHPHDSWIDGFLSSPLQLPPWNGVPPQLPPTTAPEQGQPPPPTYEQPYPMLVPDIGHTYLAGTGDSFQPWLAEPTEFQPQILWPTEALPEVQNVTDWLSSVQEPVLEPPEPAPPSDWESVVATLRSEIQSLRESLHEMTVAMDHIQKREERWTTLDREVTAIKKWSAKTSVTLNNLQLKNEGLSPLQKHFGFVLGPRFE